MSNSSENWYCDFIELGLLLVPEVETYIELSLVQSSGLETIAASDIALNFCSPPQIPVF